ncbi:hypothetical protein GLOIN_2v1820860 [Rhizophagus clarus]|uniref:Uncharacterized protein n=1 Tax=Rhizophagus clarus TaxID=94130 RepID=A0A8H3QHN5_9GLOM|nr:hypothetical protein GLOIN_2v1820860 [Rhizophagus clarus]
MKTNNVSIHATTNDDALITYDIYVKLSDVEEYFTVENKTVYIEILSQDYRGFVGTKINKDDNEIIIKNSLYKGMLNMVMLFNHKCRQHPFLKMYQKTYFLIDGLRVFSKEFKILNIPKYLFIRKSGLKPSKNNPDTITVFIIVKDLDKCKKLKDVCTVYGFAIRKINGPFDMAPEGTDLLAWLLEVMNKPFGTAPGGTDLSAQLLEILDCNSELKMMGSSHNYNVNWSDRKRKLARILTIRLPFSDKVVTITHNEVNHQINIRQEEHYNDLQQQHKHQHKHKFMNAKHHTSKSPHNAQYFTYPKYATGSNTCTLDKRRNTIITFNSAQKTTINNPSNSISSNSSTNHNDRIIEGARVIFSANDINSNLNSLNHSSNFINLKIGFHNINGLIVHPLKLELLTTWCQDHNFDFMGIAETNINCTALQY